MQSLYQTYYQYIYKPVATIYLKTDSNIRFDGFKLKVFKEVFHPKLFFSSKYVYEFLNAKNLAQKQFLEIGCGSGVLSLLAFRKKAIVTAVDIDPKAVENTRLNFETNFKNGSDNFKTIQSDVFSNVTQQVFDVIAINPPYYFKKVEVNTQLAWYCGENGEYFVKLFSGLKHYMNAVTKVFLILAENAEIDKIKELATEHGVQFTLADQRKIKFEVSYIFQLSLID